MVVARIGTQAKPAGAKRSILNEKEYYAVTIKPMTLKDRNNEHKLEELAGVLFEGKLTDIKYELDKRMILHIHAVYPVDKKIKSFFPYQQKGYSVHLKHLATPTDKAKWLNYLKKGPPTEEVLFSNYAVTRYLFLNDDLGKDRIPSEARSEE